MKTENAEYWIEKLGLEKHMEGGFFRETYRSPEQLKRGSLPERFPGHRDLMTSIYFLLKSNELSALHRLRSDEIWHFYTGSSLTLKMISPGGTWSEITLGKNFEQGQVLQAVVKAGTWFAAEVDRPESFSLAGCTVSPGFDFDDFELDRKSTRLNSSHYS
mgnify:CR=1 FL=1